MRKKTIKTQRRILAALLVCILLLCGCGQPKVSRQTETYYTWFDTVTTVTAYDTPARFEAACALVAEVLEGYHKAADIYYEYSGVVNARSLNALAGTGPVAVDSRLLELVQFGQQMYDLTDGLCSIALGSVLALWHDAREAAVDGIGTLPAEEALLAAAEHCRMEDVIVDASNGTVELRDAAMSLDFGAIAKGYAAEQAAQALAAAGYTGYALSVGGNVRTVGTKAENAPWVAGIQNPDTEAAQSYLASVELTDAALVTSGSYQRYFECDGVRFHHIIDPATLHPRNELLSVTILSPDSGVADALSTAVFNLPIEQGKAFIESLEQTEACWITAEGELVYSSGFPQNR